MDKSVEKKEEPTYMELVYSQPSDIPALKTVENQPEKKNQQTTHVTNNSPASAVRGGYLAKPSNIYAEPRNGWQRNSLPLEHLTPVKQPVLQELPAQPSVQKEEEPSFDMQLVIKDEVSTAWRMSLGPHRLKSTHRRCLQKDPRDAGRGRRPKASCSRAHTEIT